MRIFPLLTLLAIVFVQCKKNDPTPNNPVTKPALLDFRVDPNYFVDTVTFGYPGRTNGGYVFHYDNFNRVSDVKFYEYFFEQPTYNDRTCTFYYTGSNTLPYRMHLFTHQSGAPTVDSFNVYFFYNADQTKNKDSIIDLSNPAKVGIRNYFYDSAFRYAKAVYRLKGDTVTTLRDSVRIKNLNCDSLVSLKMVWRMPGYLVQESSFSSYCYKYDDKVNPFSKLNIFPALFLSNFIIHDYRSPASIIPHNFFIDFNTTNNIRIMETFNYYSGYNRLKESSDYEKYDAKNRITEKPYIDSSGNTHLGVYFVKYKYHN